MTYVRTVPYSEAKGEAKEAYDGFLKARGFISNVTSASALRPHLMNTLVVHHKSIMMSDSGVTRSEREMVATVVSALNKCQY